MSQEFTRGQEIMIIRATNFLEKASNISYEDAKKTLEGLNYPDYAVNESLVRLNIKPLEEVTETKKICIKEEVTAKEALELTKKSDLDQFFISLDTKVIGKPQAINPTKVQISLAHKLVKKDSQDNDREEFYFLHNSIDGRDLKAYGKKTSSEEFFLYKLIANEREYTMLSCERLDTVEQAFTGMVLQSTSSTEINRRFSLRGYVNLFFVGHSKPTIRILDHTELLNLTKEFSTEEFLDFLFYHEDDHRVYKQPKDYSYLVGCTLVSGKREGYPLHLITIGGAGLGKTKKEEALNSKFRETQGIFEASNSRMKGLIPSFKEKIASQGYILNCNRVALIDELFKMIEASFSDSHSSSSSLGNILQQFNPLLEHKKRTVGSGNDNSLLINPTAKVITDCNPLSNKYTLPEHLNVLDVSTLSRFLVWVIDSEDYDFIQKQKEDIYDPECSGDSPKTLKYNEFLSIYDTLNAFTCKISELEVRKVYRAVTSQLFDDRLMPIWKARGMHHTYLIIDGLTKLRCLFEDRTTIFNSNQKDYNLAERILIRLIKNMQSPIARGTR